MDDWRIEPFDRSHERSEFSCGKASLDDFLRKLVKPYEERNLGRTYVAVPSGEKKICGYYTLASGAISFENLPPAAKKLPKHPVPVILLARLAVDVSAQRRGLGELLLLDALRRSLQLAETVGVYAVEVDAIDVQAKTFYEKYGFESLLDEERHLYLPIATIRGLFP